MDHLYVHHETKRLKVAGGFIHTTGNTRLLLKRLFMLCLQFSESRLTRVKQGGRVKHVPILLHKMLVHAKID